MTAELISSTYSVTGEECKQHSFMGVKMVKKKKKEARMLPVLVFTYMQSHCPVPDSPPTQRPDISNT